MRRLLCAIIVVSSLATSGEAAAQYRNFTFGFDAGYMYLTEEFKLDQHGFTLGLFGGYKGSDHWWFYSRADVTFRDEGSSNAGNTVVMLHAVPVSVRYYLLTDNFRPYAGLTNSFQTLFNVTDAVETTVYWGPGITLGAEIKLQRDLFLGFEANAFHMFNFEGDDAQIVTALSQLIFFL